MFVPVSCTSCGKPFQVPETALGKLAPCPWCAAVVTALPVSVPQSDPQSEQPPAPAPEPESPKQPAPAPEPLSLDDAPAPDQKPVAKRSERLMQKVEPVAPPARSLFTVATVLIGFVVVVVVMSATVFYLGYRSGKLPDTDWTEFTAPDGSFTVALPGRPTEADVDPVSESSLAGGKSYTVRRWYAQTTAWVRYSNLEPGLVQKLRTDSDRVVAAGALRVVRDRELVRFKGTITKEAEVRLDAGWGVEIHMDTPDGPVVERLVLWSEGALPRLYVYGIQGKHVTPDGAASRRLIASFRVNN
jgi:hypothetical protein